MRIMAIAIIDKKLGVTHADYLDESNNHTLEYMSNRCKNFALNDYVNLYQHEGMFWYFKQNQNENGKNQIFLFVTDIQISQEKVDQHFDDILELVVHKKRNDFFKFKIKYPDYHLTQIIEILDIEQQVRQQITGKKTIKLDDESIEETDKKLSKEEIEKQVQEIFFNKQYSKKSCSCFAFFKQCFGMADENTDNVNEKQKLLGFCP